MAKESICRNCFHSYVCEQFNENKDDNNEKCHFFNDHYVHTADVVPKSEYVEVIQLRNEFESLYLKYSKAKSELAREIFEEIEKYWIKSDTLPDCARLVDLDKISELKKKYTEVDE